MDVATLTRVENLDLDQIEDEGEDSCSEHDGSTDLGWVKETLSGLVNKPDSHDPDREDRAESAEDLDAMVAERVLRIGVLCGDTQGQDRDAEADDVRGDVGSVRHDGDRVRHVATRDLDANEDKGSDEDDAKLACSLAIALHGLETFLLVKSRFII